MKFCKDLQRVADMSNPEWAVYWTNYKKLKKLIKRLDSLSTGDKDSSSGKKESPTSSSATSSSSRVPEERTETSSSSKDRGQQQQQQQQQQRGDRTTETTITETHTVFVTATVSRDVSSQHCTTTGSRRTLRSDHEQRKENDAENGRHQSVDNIRQNHKEVEFFKLLHSEFHKAVHFFDRAIAEFSIREERVRDGMEIIKQQERNEMWNVFARSVYRLYMDLLLLETFCIMTYCGFSKILKKHDKRTGFETKNAFMSNVVNNANFTNYASLQDMINRCEQVYSEVSDRLTQEGNIGLYEDERLFIDVVHQLNRQP